MKKITDTDRAAIEAVLADHATFVVATLEQAAPWLTAMYMGYEFDDDGVPTFYCAQHLGSRAAQNAAARSAVAVFVGGQEPTRWLQIAANAELLPEDGHAHANAVLVTNAPEAAAYVQFAIDQSGGVTYLAIQPNESRFGTLPPPRPSSPTSTWTREPCAEGTI